MKETKRHNPGVTDGRIVKIEGRDPFMEDERGNRWSLDQVNFYFPHMTNIEGALKWMRPFRYDEKGNLIHAGVVFPVFFKNGNLDEPVVMPFGKFGLGEIFEKYDARYDNFEQTKEIRENDSRKIGHSDDGEGNLEATYRILENGSPVGELRIGFQRAGKIAIAYSTTDEGQFPADIELMIDGTANLNIRGDAVISVDGKTNLVCSEINLGGEKAHKIAFGDVWLQKFNQHVHLDSMGLPTSPPTVPLVDGEVNSQQNTTD